MAVNIPSAVLIDVTGGTESLDDVYVAVAASGFPGNMARTGAPGSYVYTIIDNCVLRISSGGTLNMVDGDTLEWDLAGSQESIDIRSGGVFNATTNCTLIGDKNDTHSADIEIEGIFNLIGTSGNEVIMEQWDDIFWTCFAGNGPSAWDYVICRNPVPTESGGVMMYMYLTEMAEDYAHSFTNVTFSSDDDRGRLYLYGDLSEITFDNIIIDNIYEGVYGQALFKFSNSTFQNIYNIAQYQRGCNMSLPYKSSEAGAFPQGRDFLQQPKITYDNCIFDNNYTRGTTRAAGYTVYQTTIKYKDCTFQNANYGIMIYYGANTLLQGTTTNTCTDPLYWSGSRGKLFHVFALNLTIQDQSENVIPDARVVVSQSEDNEHHAFITNEDGQIKDLYQDDPVFVEKEETNDGVYTQWSDSISSGRYHNIKVMKDGYQVWTKNVEFIQDQTIIAKMLPITSTRFLPQ